MTATLIQLTDTHLFADPDTVLHGANPRHSLERVLEDLAATAATARGLLVTGDLVHDESEAGYRWLARRLHRLGLPVYWLAGNHDDPALMERLWGEDFQRPRRADVGPWSLLLLASQRHGEVGGRLGAAQRDEVAAMLAALDPQRPCLIAVHHPPLPVGSPWMDAIGLADGPELMGLLRDFPMVKAVVCGHIHQTLEGRAGHVNVYGTPSTWVQFRPNTETPVIDDRPPAYRVLTLEDDGNIRSRVRWLAAQA